MLRLFQINDGLIKEAECSGEGLADQLVEADWIDAHEPSVDERALLQSLLHTELPDSDEIDEIEASARCFVDPAGIHVHSLMQVDCQGKNIIATLFA